MLVVNIEVKTRSKIEGVEELKNGSYIVRVNVPPVDGKANKRVIELLAKHFKKPKSKISLDAGKKSKKKIFLIE